MNKLIIALETEISKVKGKMAGLQAEFAELQPHLARLEQLRKIASDQELERQKQLERAIIQSNQKRAKDRR